MAANSLKGSSLSVLTTCGPADLTGPLAKALNAQWTYGFPTVPQPGRQLTHGFLHYPAGMQALTVAHLLQVLPAGLLLDPFVGGGTTLVVPWVCWLRGRGEGGAACRPLSVVTAQKRKLSSSPVPSRMRRSASGGRARGGEWWGEVVPGLEYRRGRAMVMIPWCNTCRLSGVGELGKAYKLRVGCGPVLRPCATAVQGGDQVAQARGLCHGHGHGASACASASA